MRSLRYLSALLVLLATNAVSAERYTEARIAQVETNDDYVLLFLDWVSGDAPPMGSGLSNEPVNKYYLMLANSSADIVNRRHFMATALTAQSQGSVVRFRWEDAGTNANRIVVMLVRS